VRTGALSSGQVDLIEDISGNDVALFRDDPEFTYQRALNTGTPYTLYLNITHGPTRDVLVRRAIMAAADVETVIRSIYRGERTRAWGALTPADRDFYDASIERGYGFDPAQANRLLD
jgi:peptide/nickel transport system substrate-binding protein